MVEATSEWPRMATMSAVVDWDAAAMLTALVNIAVFAALQPCVEGILLANAAFKPVCHLHELDIARYGRQTRQEVARSRQDRGNEWHNGRQKRQGSGG